jgi:hypothetical protein
MTVKRIATVAFVLMICALVVSPALAANPVRVSQVYGGGGGSSLAYNYDFVELFNASGVPVNISGWAVEYGSATGNWGSSTSNIAILPAGSTIPACGYFLLQVGSGGTAGSALPVTADFIQTSGPAISQSNGKVGLFNAVNSNLACGSELAGTLVDKVAFGTSNCAEVTATPALTNATTAWRKVAGMTDTDNNFNDFTVVASTSVTIHNRFSPANTECLAVPTVPSSWGNLKAIYR